MMYALNLCKIIYLATSKINESHDKQKAPVATISPWITPTQNSQGFDIFIK